MNHDIAQEIDRVIDTLTEYGWIQGNYGSTETGFCIAGAYMYGVTVDQDSINEFAHAIFGAAYPNEDATTITECDITFWNDCSGRTFEDVILHLKEAQHRLQES